MLTGMMTQANERGIFQSPAGPPGRNTRPHARTRWSPSNQPFAATATEASCFVEAVAARWSRSGAREWKKPERSTLPNPRSKVEGITLTDGRLLLVYNHAPKGRTPLMRADGSGQTKLTKGSDHDDVVYGWTSDQQQLVIGSNPDSCENIYLMDTQAGAATHLTDDPGVTYNGWNAFVLYASPTAASS